MKVMNHSQYQKSLKKMDLHSLYFVLNDAKEAIRAYPENPNCGYYQDEIHYIAAELNRRQKSKR